ncbi:Uncharacterized protein BM_BM458 [Brugia malayi]|uniref:Bm458 n=1 Tax=Brugia malayi TaxID=6279 RepID=A0A0K0JFA8_BRUMA|nr:Uncharacterized protein BM_BM458 [Brugia malayi]CDP95817.1 Bm458 [Brugia malayi]VIO99669.1 Uncharacterized protein BM_BM458 [Brugia malayi]
MQEPFQMKKRFDEKYCFVWVTQLEEKRKLGTERHFKEHSVEAVLEKENEERVEERERERGRGRETKKKSDLSASQ